MTAEAYIHLAPEEDEPDVWCFSVYYAGTLAQIRLHGTLHEEGTARARAAFELDRLGKALVSLARRPSAIGWEQSVEHRRAGPLCTGP